MGSEMCIRDSPLQIKICKIHCKNVYFCFLGHLGCAFRVPSTVLFVLILFNPLFSTEFSSLFGKVLPAFVGKHDFQSCMYAQSRKTNCLAFQTDRTCVPLRALVAPQKFKNNWKMSIFCLMPIVDDSVSHCVFYRLHVGGAFRIFVSLLLCFFRKKTPPAGGSHIT